MSVNLVDLVLKQVGGNVPGILGSLLGESADRTQGAIAGAVPAILGGLMGAVAKGGDTANQLNAAIDQQNDGLLDDLTGILGSGQHKQIAEQGSNLLSSLLGDGVIGSLVGAIGKFSGLGGGSTKSLLGTLAPIVLSMLSRQKREQGLDAGGMVNLLMDQRDHVEKALPSGMASALGGGSFMDSLMGGAQSATSSISEAVETAAGAAGTVAGAAAVSGAAEAVSDTAHGAATAAATTAREGVETVGRAASSAGPAAAASGRQASEAASRTASDASAAAAGAAQSGGSWLRWLLPLIILLALLWFAYKFLAGGDMEQAASDAGDAATPAVEATTDAASDAADAASDAATAVTEGASDAADAATDAANDAATAATDAASDAAGAAGSAVESMTAMVGDIDVGGELTSAFDSLTETLSGITDKASAEAAIPTLESVNSGLDSVAGLAGQLPEATADGVSTMVDQGLAGIDAAMASLNEISAEIGEVLQPVIDQIKEKLAAFTQG